VLHLHNLEICVNFLSGEVNDLLLFLVEGGVVTVPLLVTLARLVDQEISL